MGYFKFMFAGAYRCAIFVVGAFSGFGSGRRSDYWSGDKDPIIPDDLPSKTSRRRRRRFRKFKDMDARGEGVNKHIK